MCTSSKHAQNAHNRELPSILERLKKVEVERKQKKRKEKQIWLDNSFRICFVEQRAQFDGTEAERNCSCFLVCTPRRSFEWHRQTQTIHLTRLCKQYCGEIIEHLSTMYTERSLCHFDARWGMVLGTQCQFNKSQLKRRPAKTTWCDDWRE